MYSKRRIAIGLVGSVGLWIAVAALLLGSGVAVGSYPVGGVGGMNVTASTVDAQQMLLYPGTAETRGGETPAMVTEFRNVTIEDFEMTMTFDADRMPGLAGQFRVTFTSANDADLVAEGVLLKASAIRADQAVFGQFTLDESQGTHPRDKLEATGDQANLTGDVRIQAHYLAVREFDLEAFRLGVAYDPDDDGTFEYQL